MGVESAADIAALFDADEFAEAAVYQSPDPGVDPVPCLVILDRGQGRDRFGSGEQQAAGTERRLWVQAGDGEGQIPDVRRDGLFTITLDGELLRVAGLPRLDQIGHLWLVDLIAAD